LTFDLEVKIATPVTPAWGTFARILAFLHFLYFFLAKSPYWTDGRTDGRTSKARYAAYEDDDDNDDD